jgi:hypothetical protein
MGILGRARQQLNSWPAGHCSTVELHSAQQLASTAGLNSWPQQLASTAGLQDRPALEALHGCSTAGFQDDALCQL